MHPNRWGSFVTANLQNPKMNLHSSVKSAAKAFEVDVQQDFDNPIPNPQ
jgi:hypothetical protein